MSRQIAVEGYGTVEMSDADMEKLNRGETVSLNFYTPHAVSEETRELYFRKGHEEMMENYHRNPECRDGKHRKCRRLAWNEATDQLAIFDELEEA